MHTTCGTHPSGVLFALVIPICASSLFTLSIIYLGISMGRLFDFWLQYDMIIPYEDSRTWLNYY